MITVDLAAETVRDLNQRLHDLPADTNERAWRVVNPKGAHALVAGLDRPVEVLIEGHVGYYCAGMNKQASVVIDGHCGVGVAENIMSGEVRVKGNASQSAGASGQGGLLVIEGDASARCGISMKGVDIVVGGSVGHMSAFMAQTGNLVVCGDAGQSLGDSIYEAKLYVQGNVESLGADCVEKEMTPHHIEKLGRLLVRAGVKTDPQKFKRFGSARRLYHFHIDHADAY
jgi:glutamate synthase domain-containing protein 3